MRRVTPLFGAALLALTMLLAPAVAADTAPVPTPGAGTSDGGAGTPPEEVLTWSITPGPEPETGATDRISIRTTVDPGAAYSDEVVVTNYSEQDVEFTLFASDGVIGEDGAFDILGATEVATDSGAWISVPDSVQVPAQGSVAVPFTIAVPADATPGDHPAGITAGLMQTGETAGTSVGFEARVGVRIHLRVAGDLAPAIEIVDYATRFEGTVNPFAAGAVVATYTVRNTGNTRLGAEQALRSTGAFGIASGESTVLASQAELLPGDEVAVQVRQEGVWPLGWVTSELTATPFVVGADDLGSAGLTVVTATSTATAVPWSHLAVLLILVGLVLLVLLRRRRRRAAYETALQRAREEGLVAGRKSESTANQLIKDPCEPSTCVDKRA